MSDKTCIEILMTAVDNATTDLDVPSELTVDELRAIVAGVREDLRTALNLVI